MTSVRAPHPDTGRRDVPHAESLELNPRREGPSTPQAGMVEAAHRRTGSTNAPIPVAAANVTLPGPPPPSDNHTPEPASSSEEPVDANLGQTIPLEQDDKSTFGSLVKRFGFTRTMALLGFILALVVGAVTWSGMNYANYYTKKSYDLALYQTCRSYEDLQNSTACRSVLATGLNQPRSLPNIRLAIGRMTANITRPLSGILSTSPRICDNEPTAESGCLMRALSFCDWYSSCISSSEIRVRVFWALISQVAAIGFYRAGMSALKRRSMPTAPTSNPSIPPTLSPVVWAVSVVAYNIPWVLITGPLQGRLSGLNAVSVDFWVTLVYYLWFPFVWMWVERISSRTRAFVLCLAAVNLATLAPRISDAAGGTVMGLTFLACCMLVLDYGVYPLPSKEKTSKEMVPL